MFPNNQIEEITPTELKRRRDAGEDLQVIDVREQREYDYAQIPNSKLIPLGEIVNRMSEIDENRETVVSCHHGSRSAQAIFLLTRAGFKGTLLNHKGGIDAYSNEVDPNVPKY